MIRAVIFDLDGTVADTVSALREGVNLTMEAYGYPTHTDADILRFINNGARELIRRAMPETLRTDEALVSRVLADYNRAYATVYHHTDKPYDGIPALVRSLKEEMGLLIGVLSNKQDAFVRNLSAQLLPAGFFDAAQGVIEGKPTKPNRFLSERVAAALGVDLSECVMVGDSDVDIRTAREAGMRHVGVSWGYRDEAFLRENGATLIAHDPTELLQILKRMIETEKGKED